MHGDHKFSDLVEAIYDAGLQPAQWRTFFRCEADGAAPEDMTEQAFEKFGLCPTAERNFSFVMAGHSRPKDGVASARLCPAIHVFLV